MINPTATPVGEGSQDMGASADADRAVVNGAGQAVSALRASIPSAFDLMQSFYLSRYYEPNADRPADNIQAAIEFTLDRYLSPDRDRLAYAIYAAWHDLGEFPFPLYQREAEMLADAAIKALLAQAIEARRAETQGGAVHESAVGVADAPEGGVA